MHWVSFQCQNFMENGKSTLHCLSWVKHLSYSRETILLFLCLNIPFPYLSLHFRHSPMKTMLLMLTQSMHIYQETLHRALEGT